MNATGMARNTPTLVGTGTEVRIHYFRPNNDYGNWHLWMWPAKPVSQPGDPYEFKEKPDLFGKFAVAHIPADASRIGIIVYCHPGVGNILEGDAKDISEDRFISITGADCEIWLVQNDPSIYYSYRSAWRARWAALDALGPAFGGVFLDGPDVIHATYRINGSYNKPISLRSGAGGFAVTDSKGPIKIRSVTSTTESDTTVYTLRLERSPDVSDRIILSYADHGGGASKLVTPRRVLDEPRYNYAGNDLGATYSSGATSFRLWAPTASNVLLTILKDARGDLYKSVQMDRPQDGKGSWFKQVIGNLEGMYYLFEVTCQDTTRAAIDPYAKNISINGKWAQIVDLHRTNPTETWESDGTKRFAHPLHFDNPVDAVIYEVHVRDFSIDEYSGVQPPWRGKYLAFTESGTTCSGPDAVGSARVKTGVDSLQELGITHVELLPIQSCATLDEVKGGDTAYAPDGDNSRYNWGYDPRDYNVPNGAYATTPNGSQRIREVKQMVQALHEAGIGVILDVVFGHIYSVDRFDNIVPQYFFRTDELGAYSNNCNMGNELAAERYMVRKFIVDSVTYWMEQYHIDGFRFDQMYLLGKETVLAVRDRIRSINPGAIILGEAWGDEKTSVLPLDQQFTRGSQKGKHVAIFNSDVLDSLAGSAQADPPRGYVNGPPGTNYASVKEDITGDISYHSMQGVMRNPDETINYASCHDDYTLWDRLTQADESVPSTVRRKMDKLAQTIVFTCQGIPFVQGGEEFLRTRGSSRNLFDNAYNAGDIVNKLDWSRKARYLDIFNYYKGLIRLRREHRAFRMTSPKMIETHLAFLDVDGGAIYFRLSRVRGDPWDDILVSFNPTQGRLPITLPSGEWVIVADGGTFLEDENPRIVKGGAGAKPYFVKAYSASILYRGDARSSMSRTWLSWRDALQGPRLVKVDNAVT